MRTKILILALLLSISQAYAWGDREQGALIGFISGMAVSNVYQSHRLGDGHRNAQVRAKRRTHHHDHRPLHKKVFKKHHRHAIHHSHIRQPRHQRHSYYHRDEHRHRR